ALLAELISLAVRDDLDHHVRRLAELPEKVRAVLLGPEILVHLHIDAEERIGDERGLLHGREDPHIRSGDELAGLAFFPGWGPCRGAVKGLREEALLLLGRHVVHGGVILRHDPGGIRRLGEGQRSYSDHEGSIPGEGSAVKRAARPSRRGESPSRPHRAAVRAWVWGCSTHTASCPAHGFGSVVDASGHSRGPWQPRDA